MGKRRNASLASGTAHGTMAPLERWVLRRTSAREWVNGRVFGYGWAVCLGWSEMLKTAFLRQG